MEEENLSNIQPIPENDQSGISVEEHSESRSILKNFFSGKVFKSFLIPVLTLLFVLFTVPFVCYIAPAIAEMAPVQGTKISNDPELKKDAFYKKQQNTLTRDLQKLSRKYNSYTSGQSYVVINTTENRFFLYRNRKLVREGFCSSGSYTMLKSAEGDRKWVFKTPKGKYRIQGKTTHPVWRKPDWAFVEEGLPIPSAFHPSRYEYGVLGDYALSLGDGYLIHGTIYKRFLGMPVTHGCVRLNDEDLEAIYNTLDIGSKVYIF
ncbi:MAG TPA: L,D-transpeptidase [Bacteroidales bacterium]|nr:L,D-transpeptidase [Bacteroidales bacterium]